LSITCGLTEKDTLLLGKLSSLHKILHKTFCKYIHEGLNICCQAAAALPSIWDGKRALAETLIVDWEPPL
jgi:hypothetical protein